MNLRFENTRLLAHTLLLIVTAGFGAPAGAQEAGALDPPEIRTTLLPDAPAGLAKPSDYAPAHPFAERAPGLFSRTLFKADQGKDFRVEVLDLMVVAGQKPVPLKLGGPAVLEVRLGEGTLRQHGKPRKFETGAILQLDAAGETETIEGRSRMPIQLRAYVITAR